MYQYVTCFQCLQWFLPVASFRPSVVVFLATACLEHPLRNPVYLILPTS